MSRKKAKWYGWRLTKRMLCVCSLLQWDDYTWLLGAEGWSFQIITNRLETFKLYNRLHYSSAGRLMYPTVVVLSAREESAEKILNSRRESSSQLSTFYIGCSKFTSHALWLSQRWKIKGREKRDFSDYNQWSVWWVDSKMISDDRLWNLSWFPTLVTYAKNCWKEFQ